MPRVIEIDLDNPPGQACDYQDALLRIIERQNELNLSMLQGALSAVRKYEINRHLIEAQERTSRALEQVGGVNGLRRIIQQAAAMDRFGEFLWPGGFKHFAVLIQDNLTEAEENHAITRLAHHFGVKLKNLSAKTELVKIARRESRDYLEVLVRNYLPEAIRETLRQMRLDKPERMRFGKDWRKTRSGKVAKLRPSQLSLVDLACWFKQRVFNNCCKLLLPDDDARGKRALFDENTTLFQDGNTRRNGQKKINTAYSQYGLDALTAAERSKNQGSQLAPQILERLAPREREMLSLLRDGHTRAQAAKKLRIKISTVRVMMFQINKKRRAKSSG